MMRVNLLHTRLHHIRHTDLLHKLDLHDFLWYLDQRVLGWAGHLARMPPSRLPRKALTSYLNSPRHSGGQALTYGRTLYRSLRRRKIESGRWMVEAMDREKWRAATKANISLHLPKKFSPGDFIGRSVEKRYGTKWYEGCVTQYDRDSRTNEWIWHVEYPDGDASDYNLEEMTRMLIDNDDLDTATRRLNRPACLLGRKIAKYFGRALHIGTITDHDTDKATGNVIWRIIFEDGDQEDLDLPQLTPLLLAACGAAGTGSGSCLRP